MSSLLVPWPTREDERPMTDRSNLPPSLSRVYGDKEIGQILKRATELQGQEPSAPSSSGLTLQELEEVAVEAGIDPRFLMQFDGGNPPPALNRFDRQRSLVLVRSLVNVAPMPYRSRCVPTAAANKPTRLGRVD